MELMLFWKVCEGYYVVMLEYIMGMVWVVSQQFKCSRKLANQTGVWTYLMFFYLIANLGNERLIEKLGFTTDFYIVTI